MMNDETEQFENRLRRQPLKKIPAAWRAEFFREGRRAAVPNNKWDWLSTINHQLSTLLWPHPKAWAGLAAVWVFIFVLNFSMHDPAPMVAEKSQPPSPEVLVELKKQQLLFAELVGTHEISDADQPKIFSPKPRSERVEISMA